MLPVRVFLMCLDGPDASCPVFCLLPLWLAVWLWNFT